jgi:hypothetical protein
MHLMILLPNATVAPFSRAWPTTNSNSHSPTLAVPHDRLPMVVCAISVSRSGASIEIERPAHHRRASLP